jgi:hypothetical protein
VDGVYYFLIYTTDNAGVGRMNKGYIILGGRNLATSLLIPKFGVKVGFPLLVMVKLLEQLSLLR